MKEAIGISGKRLMTFLGWGAVIVVTGFVLYTAFVLILFSVMHI